MQDKKTIAFYIGSLARGGAEHVMVNLADYFSSQGYQVYLVTKLEDPPEYDVPFSSSMNSLACTCDQDPG